MLHQGGEFFFPDCWIIRNPGDNCFVNLGKTFIIVLNASPELFKFLTFSSEGTVNLSLLIKRAISSELSATNSSLSTTSLVWKNRANTVYVGCIKRVTYVKCWDVYFSARLSRSMQPCKSANLLIPRQFEGWSWDTRNSQQASLTNAICKRLAAGSKI